MTETLPYLEEEVVGVGSAYIAFAIEELKSRGIEGDQLLEVVGFSASYNRDTHPHVGPVFDWLEKEHSAVFLEAVDIGYRFWEAMKEQKRKDIEELRPQMFNIIGHALWLAQESGNPTLQEAVKQIVI